MYIKSLITVLSVWTAVSSAQCGRTQLIQARDAFFQSAKTGAAPASLASSAKISMNNELVPLAKTPFQTLGKSTFSKLNVQAIDTEICEIATFRVATDQVLSTRLKLNAQGSISEVEFLQAVKGDQFFKPSGFPNETPALFNQKQTPTAPPIIPKEWTAEGGMFNHGSKVNTATCKATSGTPRLWNRKELLYAASSYADGLKGKPFDSCVFTGPSCPRNENGVTTSKNCAKGTGNFGFTVKGRRWTVDTETGVVLGAFYFDYSGIASRAGKNLFLHEYFKVDKAGLLYIFAPMKNIPPAQAAAQLFSQ